MYAEAFPSIDIVVADGQVKRGAKVCRWINEYGLPVGAIRIKELTETIVRLRYVFYGTPNVEKEDDDIIIELTRKDRALYKGRPMMNCPQCGGEHQRLFYVERHWKCSLCHDLTTANRLYNRPVKRMRRRLFLGALISIGRQKGQHETTFQKIVDEYESLREFELPDWQKHEFYYLQVPQWLQGDEIPHEVIDPRHWAYGWTAGDGLGFRRLAWRKVCGTDQTPAELERKERHLTQARKKMLKATTPGSSLPASAEKTPTPAERKPHVGLHVAYKDGEDDGAVEYLN